MTLFLTDCCLQADTGSENHYRSLEVENMGNDNDYEPIHTYRNVTAVSCKYLLTH